MCGFVCTGICLHIYSCTHTGREDEGNQLSFDMDRKEERTYVCVAPMSHDEGQDLLRHLLSVQIRSFTEGECDQVVTGPEDSLSSSPACLKGFWLCPLTVMSVPRSHSGQGGVYPCQGGSQGF